MKEDKEVKMEEAEESKDLTADEKKFLIKVLTNLPLQGNLQSLPKAMADVMAIIKKLS